MKNETLNHKLQAIELLILDVDGVLTDGRIWFDANGEEYKTFHTQDGLGIKRLQKAGIAVAVITGRKSRCVRQRLQALNIQHLFEGIDNKLPIFEQLLSTLNLSADQAAYIGDDLPDLPIMQRVGMSIAVANAVPEVAQTADWQTTRCGGMGAVREACDLIYHSLTVTHES